MALVFISIFIFLVFAGWLYVTVKYYDSSFVTYVYHWDYRVLCTVCDMYRRGLQRPSPDSYDYFRTEAIGYISKYLIEHKSFIESQNERIIKAQEIVYMLNCEPYIRYYFNKDKSFTGLIYREMWRDYRTGEYISKDYFAYDALRKKMPAEIRSNEKAFNEFWKLVQEVWFDETTGMYCEVDKQGNKINHNQIGRAIYLICQRNGIGAASKVFAPLWAATTDEGDIEKMEKKIRGWYRADQIKNVEQVDKIVLNIINSD